MEKILVFDPSGNMSKGEGKGTSGWAIFENGDLKDFGEISSEGFSCPEAYWDYHLTYIKSVAPSIVVCESYKLFGHKSAAQTGSEMETPQLIGIIRHFCWSHDVSFIFQDPKDKVRFNDMVLEDTDVIKVSRGPSGKITGYMCQGRRTSMHMRDAIRHGLYYQRYGKKVKK